MERGGVRRGLVAAYSAAVFAYMYSVGSIGFWLPLYARDLGYGYTEVAGLATVYFSVLLPVTLAAGVAADVTGRPRGLAAGSLALSAAAGAGLALASSYPALAGLRALQALGLALVLPISVGALTRGAGVRGGVRIAAAMQGAGMAAGALAGGLLYSAGGWPWVAASYTLVGSAAAAWVAAAPPPPAPPGRVGVRDVASALARAPLDVRLVLAILFLRNTLATGAFSVLSVIFARVVGVSLEATAAALAVNPIVQALAAGPSSRASRGREVEAFAAGVALTGVVLHAYTAAGGAAGLLAAQALLGASFSLINVSANTLIISRMPPEARYTASSLFPLAFNGGWIAGTAIGGPAMDALGVEEWLRAAGLGCYALGAASLAAASRAGGGRRGG